jgi:flagellar biosynthesis/type III secretory pathway M-ring protein FliF/YscJ
MKKYINRELLAWLLVIALTSLLIISNWVPKPEITTLPPDNRIDSLHNIVDSLDQRIIKLRHDYDSAQQNIKDSIIYIQTKNAKDISNIHNYTLDQRDSLWSTFKP